KAPKSVALKLQLADFYDLQGNYAEAERWYRQVLAQDAVNAFALNNLAWLLATQPDHGSEALALINRGIEHSGPQPSLLDTRALAYLALGQSGPALADLKEVIAEGPKPLRYLHLARAHYLAGNRAAAREAYRQTKALGLDTNRLHPAEQSAYRQMIGELEKSE